MSAKATASFQGFPAEAFEWFRGIETDNSKHYFSTHRETYEVAVRDALQGLLDELAAEFGGIVKMFRQHRDVRFSRDKSPYKTRTYGVIAQRPDSRSALYAQLSSEGLFAGTGYYVLARDQLARFRAAVAGDETGPELEQAVRSVQKAGVETFGEALRTVPRGYPRDHPRIELLRHKSLIGGRRLEPDPDAIGREDALEHACRTWEACAPLNSWLERNVGPSDLPVDSRRR
jgi:uncharacterized protein (TIGR02453 family)